MSEDDTSRPIEGDVYLDELGEQQITSVNHQDRSFKTARGSFSYERLTLHAAGFFLPWVWCARTD